MESEVF